MVLFLRGRCESNMNNLPTRKNLMRVLLRDASTGLYFQEPEHWTGEPQKARSFKHSADAMNLARQKQVHQAEVILSFEESAYRVALPLP